MKKAFRELLAEEKPLLMPAAHDSLSARLIAKHGFRAYGIGGFPVAGCRYGLPDVGLMSFGEMVAGVRDIMTGTDLPVLVDADDGYGDVKNVTRTVETYEAMGVAGIVLEDQTSPKRCGHMAGKSVIPAEAMLPKLRAAVAARTKGVFLVARTDARAVHGLDEALRRGRLYLETGVDALFVEAPESVAELATIGKSFPGATLVVNMAEGGKTPILPPAELARLGFSMIIYPATVLLRMIHAMEGALEELRGGQLELPAGAMDFRALTNLFGLARWGAIEDGKR